MEHKPKQIIEQAREKAQKALLETCGAEIQRICDAFSHDTGLAIGSVRFGLIDCRSFVDQGPKNILSSARIDNETP